MNRYHVKIDDSVLPETYSFDELIENGLLDERDEHIQVKLIEEREWVVARDYPFANSETSNNSIIINEDSTFTRNIGNMSGYYTINDDGSINRPGNYERPPKPDTNLIWSIICISVCLPFGLLALVESVKVDSLYSNGEYDAAIRASENSKKWSMWCLWSWLIILGIIFIAAIAS